MISLLGQKTLTIQIDGGETISLQYHPESLIFSARNQTQNVSGIANNVTYIAPPETSTHTVQMSCYFTDLDGSELRKAGWADLLAGTATGATAAALAFGGRGATVVAEAALSTVSLAVGIYEQISGIIYYSTTQTPPLPGQGRGEKLTNITKLVDACKNSKKCKLVNDLAENSFGNKEYIINNVNASVESMQETTGNSVIVRVDMTLLECGEIIEVVYGA